jgi:hypothetical protein
MVVAMGTIILAFHNRWNIPHANKPLGKSLARTTLKCRLLIEPAFLILIALVTSIQFRESFREGVIRSTLAGDKRPR